MSKRFDKSAVNLELANRRREAVKTLSTERTKEKDDFLINLRCPFCGKLKASAHAQNPGRLYCWSGSCVASKGNGGVSVDEHFGIRIDFEKSCPPNDTDENAPATAYLIQQRGLSKEVLEGYDYFYNPSIRKSGKGGVLLRVGIDSKGQQVVNGRFFVAPADGEKGHTTGHIGEFIHVHTGKTINYENEVVVVEGWITEASLWDMGIQSCSVFSSVANPETRRDFFEKCKKLVLLFDNDPNGAGQEAMRRWLRAYPNATPLLLEQGIDANDLLVRHGKEEAAEIFRKNRPQYEFYAQISLAKTPYEYAELWLSHYESRQHLFVFRKETYYATLKTPRGSDQQPFVNVERCTKAAITVVSYTIDRANPARPEYRYNLEVQPSQQGRPPVQVTATGKDIATARAMNEFLLSNARINWEGDSKATTALQNLITENKKAPEVRLLSVTGYQPENKAYIFHHWAADTTGKIITPDKRGFFQLSHKQYFQPPAHSESKAIAPADIGKEKVKAIYRLISEAWGFNGVAALSWVVAGWFVNQIKEKENFFPILSLWGDPASGKSALTTLLNTIQGREGEGLPVTQLNSKKGSIRTIGQVSGLFTALLEDNERNERGFDHSFILTAYNKGPLQVQAAFSNDLQTKENPFLGTLLFCQNIEPFNSKAEKQRTISLHFKADAITDESRAAYDKLAAMSKNDLAGVLQQVLAQRSDFESNWPKEFIAAQAELGTMEERRILDNHALILAFHHIFCRLFTIKHTQDIALFLGEIGRKKCVSSAVRQTTIADHFFELLDGVKEEKAASCYHIDVEKGFILVHLPEVESYFRNKGLNFQASEPLTTALQQHPSYIRNSLIYRFPHDPDTDSSGRPKKRRVWAFSLEWHKNNGLHVEDVPRQ